MNKGNSLTKSYILEAFYRLLLQKKYDDITVCDITQKAGVSRMSFYRAYESKDDLAIHSLLLVAERLKNNIDNLGNKSLYLGIKMLFDTLQKYRHPIESFRQSEFIKQIIDLSVEKFQEAFPTDIVNKTSKYIPVFYFGAITNTISRWLEDGCKESPEEMAIFICKQINAKELLQNETGELE